MRLYLKCMPDDYYKSIFEIDYQALKLKGIKALFFDLDNTIIDYHQTKLTHETIDLLNNLEKDFTVVIISNSGYQRVFRAVGHQFKFISFAKKPLKFGFKKALKQFDIKQAEAVMIGDQLMTDIFGAKRMKMVAILVDAVKSDTDRIWTRINRSIEKQILKKMKKKAPEQFDEVLAEYAKKYE